MRTAAILLLYAAVAAGGTYLVFRPTFDSGFDSIQTERGDGMLNHLILENSWLAVSDPSYRGTLVTPPIFYPEPYVIAYSENLYGVAPVYWALRLVTPYDLAYIWWQIVLSVLNFVTFALVARWLRMPHVLAIGGAFFWAFAAVHADQIKHSQMIPRLWMPLAVYYAITLVNQPSAKSLNRMMGTTFLQCLSCIYTGWFLVVGLSVFLPLLVCLKPGAAGALVRYTRAHWLKVAGIFSLWTLAMVALFGSYLVINWGVARSYEDCYGLMPTPTAWLSGQSGQRWDQTLNPVRNRSQVTLECWLFCGFTIYALMLAAAVHLPFVRRGARPELWPAAMAGLLTAAIWFALTLATANDGDSLWWSVRHFPGGQAIRCVSRVYVVVYLFGPLGALLWLSMVTESLRRPWVRAAIFVPIVAALIYEQTGFEQGSFRRADFYPIVDRSAESLKGAKVGYVIPRYVDTNGKEGVGPYGDVFTMWVGMRANVPVVNGYSGRWPNDYPGPNMNNEILRAWLKGKYHGPVRIVDPDVPGVKPVTTWETVIE